MMTDSILFRVFLLFQIAFNRAATKNLFHAEAFLDATVDRLNPRSKCVPLSKSTVHNSFNQLINFSISTECSRSSSIHSYRRNGRIPLEALFSVEYNTKQNTTSNSSFSKVEIQRQGRYDAIFQQRLLELQNFITENGHGSIPTPYPANPPLGVWAANIRRQHVIREEAEKNEIPYKGYLTLDRKNLLLRSGFDFTPLTERQFRLRLKELKDFKEKYGHTLVPERYKDNLALGAWVSNLRTFYKKRSVDKPVVGTDRRKRDKRFLHPVISTKKRSRQRSQRLCQLEDEKMKILDELGFVWSSIDRKWYEMLEWAKAYAVVNAHLSSFRSTSIFYPKSRDNNTTLGQNDAMILENYYYFVQSINDQSMLPHFHPQNEILDFLADKNYTSDNTERPQSPNQFATSQPNISNNASSNQSNLESPPLLDYRIHVDDSLHFPLRIWMTNQRSNYHRRIENSTNSSLKFSSTMTDQRQKALEEINFPWSGRFRNRWEEVQFEVKREQERQHERAKVRRREEIEKEEEKLLMALNKPVFVNANDSFGSKEATAASEDDIMVLWGAEDDED